MCFHSKAFLLNEELCCFILEPMTHDVLTLKKDWF